MEYVQGKWGGEQIGEGFVEWFQVGCKVFLGSIEEVGLQSVFEGSGKVLMCLLRNRIRNWWWIKEKIVEKVDGLVKIGSYNFIVRFV